jgi:hypothetical protein
MYNTCVNALHDNNVVKAIPFNTDAEESFTVTNMSIARIVDIDWTGVFVVTKPLWSMVLYS